MLKLLNVNIKYDDIVLQDTSLTIESDSMVALTGPSGSGKSTLLYMMGLISDLGQSEYTFNGVVLSALSNREQAAFRKRKTGYIFQDNNLVETMTVKENLEFCARIAQNMLDDTEILTLLQYVGLYSEVDKYPANLSGGERQRLAVACALAKNPELILADEPTSALDSENAERVINLLRDISRTKGVTVVIVTHQSELAMSMDQVFEIQDKKVVCSKKPESVKTDDNVHNIVEKTTLPFSFYWRYAKRIFRTSFLHHVMIVIAAIAITMSVISIFFGRGTVIMQYEYLNQLAKNQVFVMNQSFPSSSSLDAFEYVSISDADTQSLAAITELKSMHPFISFPSFGFDIAMDTENSEGMIQFKDTSNIMKTVRFSPLEQDKDRKEYAVLPYYAEQSMHQLTQWHDASEGASVYISYQLAKVLGLENINTNIEMELEVRVPIFQHRTELKLNRDGFYPADIYIYKTVELPVTINGVLRNDVTNTLNEAGNNNIYMSIDSMLEVIEQTKDMEEEYASSPYYSSEVSYSAYMLYSKSYNDIARISDKVTKINPNLFAVSEFQDIKTMQASITGIQKAMALVSAIFLAVVMLLMSIIFINRIGARRHEIAIIKANGLSSREIVKVSIISVMRDLVRVIFVAAAASIVSFKLINGMFGTELLVYSLEYVFMIVGLSIGTLFVPTLVSASCLGRIDPAKLLRN